MKKLGLSSAVVGTTLLMAQSASAAQFLEDVTWVPQLGVQYKQLKFEQEFKGYPVEDGSRTDITGDFDADLPSLVGSVTAIYKKAYISLQYADTLDDDNVDSSVFGTIPSTGVERDDYSVTVGYNVWDKLNLFTGYMHGETNLSPDPGPDPFFVGGENFALQMQNQGLGDYQQTYEEEGWFLGGSYGWKLLDAGTLALSVAYADLDSTYKDNFPGSEFNYTGDADGFSYGINWSQPLNEHVGYYLDVRSQKYDANTEDNSNIPDYAGSSAKTEETMTTFTAGIQFYL